MRRFILFLVCIALPYALVGCATDQAQEEAVVEEEDPYALREGQTEVYGKVRTIFGNEITVAVGTLNTGGPDGMPGAADGEMGEMPDFGDAQGGGMPSMDGAGGGGERGGGPGEMGGDAGGGAREMSAGASGGERGGTAGGRGEMGGGAAAAGGNATGASGSYDLEYSGEEETYLIPVTATVQNGTGENAATVRFTQISEKSVVRVVFDENGAITLLQILQ